MNDWIDSQWDEYDKTPLYLKLDIDEFIESYSKLMNLENSSCSVSQSCKSHNIQVEISEIRTVPSKERIPSSKPNVTNRNTKVAFKPKSQSCGQLRKDRKPCKDRTNPKYVSNGMSQCVDDHSKRRRMSVRKDSKKSVPSSLQFNFPIITFQSVETRK